MKMPESPELDGLLDKALDHVAFDGWTETTFKAAAADAGLTFEDALAIAPRGALDLAVAFHRRGDRKMAEEAEKLDLSSLKYSERVAELLKLRIRVMPDREAVRRATTLFALPTHAPEGAKLIWETADHVWNALGDTSTDGNWYSKRATLSAVWASVVLFWLGDDSADTLKTDEFIDRRIENVMQIEKMKGQLRENPLTKPLMDLQESFLSRMRSPRAASDDLPGKWN